MQQFGYNFIVYSQNPNVFKHQIINMEDSQSQSYDEARLQQLRKQAQVSKAQLLQLAYSEELLLQKIDAFNKEGCLRINQQLYYDALVYFSQAEKILQYAASCGRTIDRALIITSLHNQAAGYQRIWELSRSSDYIEAIIYNVSSLLNTEMLFIFGHEVVNEGSVQNLKFADYLTNKHSLICYHLQYCAVSSQIKNHTNAFNSAQKALLLLKTYCEQLHMLQNMLHSDLSNHFERTLLLQLQNIRDFQNQTKVEIESYNQKLLYKAKKSIFVFQRKLESNTNLTKAQVKQLQSFSLGQLMQVGTTSLKQTQERVSLKVELTFIKKVYKAIYISIAHFTMATELRLIASERYGNDQNYRRESKQYKQSQAHHLIAIITAALYVPCLTKYFEHILDSFKNHYQIDLNQNSDITSDKNLSNDDLVHLQIQSVSNKDSEISQRNKLTDELRKQSESRSGYTVERSRKTDKPSLYLAEKANNCTLNAYCSDSSSQNPKLQRMNHASLSQKSQKSSKKSKRQKSKRTKQTKKIIIVQKIVSKSKSKAKGGKPRKSGSNKSRHQHSEEQEKIVHYFQYDNYTKKVINSCKGKGPADILKRINNPLKNTKSPQTILGAQLHKINKMQLKKQITAAQMPIRIFNKCKSPELKTARSPNTIKKQK